MILKLNLFFLFSDQWDTWWGVNGYMNLSRAIPNNCGISSGASFPLL
jgi:hypothetical protein